MKKVLFSLTFILFSMLFLSCQRKESSENTSHSDSLKNVTLGDITDGEVDIIGDFDGDNITETGFALVYLEGAEQIQNSIVALSFPDSKIDTLFFEVAPQGYYEFVREGDLDGFAGDEITVYAQASLGDGNTAVVTTYTSREGKWQMLIDGFNTQNLPETISKNDLIFAENGEIIYYSYQTNEASGSEPALKSERTKANVIKADAQGDFDGDKLIETAKIKLKIKGDEQSSWTYTITFSNPKIKPFDVVSASDKIELINEGQLDNTKGDELSIKKATFNGGMLNPILALFSYHNGNWITATESIFVGGHLPDSLNLSKMIFKKGHQVFYHVYNPSWTLQVMEQAEADSVEKTNYSVQPLKVN